MWYTNAYRRHLCDMHLEDWDELFFSRFSPEKYVEDLVAAQVQSPMIYLQSHVGLCYFPTKVGQMHKAFRGNEDRIKRTIDLCHEKGMPVVGYYSLIYNTREHDRHPDWRLKQRNGASVREGDSSAIGKLEFSDAAPSRYGHCCLNHPEYREFTLRQMDEILEFFDLEGLFFDMPFWPHTCYCPQCRARWAKEVGGEIPENPKPGEPDFYVLLEKKHEWMTQWVQEIADYVKAKQPGLTVEYNFASSLAGLVSGYSFNGCGGGVSKASDFVGGDLYGGIVNHSLACKFFMNITENPPFDYMLSRCKPGLLNHTLTKTYDQLIAEVMLTAAHHGATTVIDAIDPAGTTDSRFYELLGRVFGFHKQYEHWFGGDMVADVGIYFDIKSRNNPRRERYNSQTCMEHLAKHLFYHHIPFGVTGDYHELKGYSILIAPFLTDRSQHDFDRIADYVAEGGNLVLFGAESQELTERLLGCKVLGRTEENRVYVAPKPAYESLFLNFNADYPLPFDGTAPLIEPAPGAEVLATLTLPYTKLSDSRYASIHSNPPGISTEYPMVIRQKYGKGSIIWSGLNLESEDHYEYGQIIRNLMDLFGVEYSFHVQAPENVEVTVFRQENQLLAHAVVLNEQAFVSPVLPFEIAIRMPEQAAPKEVLLAPDETPIAFTYEEGMVKFKTRMLNGYDLYLIKI